jgi:hypothetical protein
LGVNHIGFGKHGTWSCGDTRGAGGTARRGLDFLYRVAQPRRLLIDE